MKKLFSLICFLSLFYSNEAQNLSINFDGINDHISIPNNASLNGTNAITLEAWIRLNSANGLQTVIGKAGAFQLNINNGQLQSRITNNGQDHVLIGGSILADTWTHIAISYQKNTKYQIYVDGTLVNSSYDYNYEIGLSNAPIIIGTSSIYPGSVSNLKGQIDDLRIWDIALSNGQILTGFYSELNGAEPGLAAYFNFDNNAAACDIQDCTNNENHGSRIGQVASSDLLPQFNAITPAISHVDQAPGLPQCAAAIGIEITQFPPAQVITCSFGAQPQLFAFQATTDCPSGVNYSVSGLETNPAQGTNCPMTNYTYTYTASDACGQSTNYVQVYTIQNDPPALICPPGACQIDCSIDNAQIIEAFDWYSDNATFTTSCNGIDPVISNNFNPNGFTSVDCNNNGFAVPNLKAIQLVTFSATDPCGRVSSCERSVLIVDNTDPVIVGEPYLTIRECDDLIQQQYDAWIFDNINNVMTASDACGGVNWSWTPLSPNQSTWTNGYAITEVFFTATDDCGNSVTKEAHFKIKNNFPPSLSGLTDKTISCSAGTPTFDTPTISNSCGDTQLTSTEITTPGDCMGESTITKTWTVTDASGATSTAVQNIFVVDNEGPVFTNVTPSVTQECTRPLPNLDDFFGTPTVTDNCNDPNQISLTSSDATIDTDCDWTTIRTWIATDECGNSATASSSITFEDTQAPIFVSVPTGGQINCGEPVTFAEPEIMDGCILDLSLLTLTFEDSSEDCANGTAGTVTRTWTATDLCGHSSTASATITVTDNEGPIFTDVAANVTMECTRPLPNLDDLFGTPTVTDNCSPSDQITLNISDVTVDTDCSWATIRTWTATDACGNVNTASTTITFVDSQAPIFVSVPTGGEINCGDAAVFGEPVIMDGCILDLTLLTLTFEDVTVGCMNGTAGSITRTWTATDLCGHSNTASSTITIIDNEGPIFSNVPADQEMECVFPNPNLDILLDTPTVTDACTPSDQITLTSNDTSVDTECTWVVTRTWTATDACGNITTAAASVTFEDTQAPIFVSVPTGGQINCGDPIVMDDPEIMDACFHTPNSVILTFEDTVEDECVNGTGTILRTWTATDGCGNASTATATFTIVDNQAPVFTSVPNNQTLECTRPLPDVNVLFGTPVVSDDCGDFDQITLDFSDVSIDTDCSWTVVRTWIATDGCGNTATASASVTYEDTQAPVFVSLPSGGQVNCGDPVLFGEPEIMDGCLLDLSLLTLTFEDSAQDCADGNAGTVTRTWTVTDLCGHSNTASATIMILDNTAPTFTFVPADETLDCGDTPQFGTPIASDDCNAVTITSVDTQGDCSVTRTWTAVDACGNTTTNGTNASQTLFFEDDEDPEFIFIPENVENVECNAIPQFVEPIAEDNCGAVTITFVETLDGMSECEDNGYGIIRVWTATDVCGNTSTVKTLLWIEEDYREPDFIFFPEDELITCDAFPPVITIEPIAVDNCSDPIITFYTEYGTGGPDSCDDEEGFDWHVVWVATDACGNVQTKIQNFWVDPYLENDMGMVSGEIYNESHEMIEEVMVNGTGVGAGIMDMTGDDGHYSLGLPMGNNYEIEPSRNDNPMNGISTYDLILMSQHILGIQSLDSPYKMIAADINNSGTITAFDLLELRKLILLIYTEFPENPSWKFIDSDYVFSNPNNPFTSTYPTSYSINQLSTTAIIDFIGIKMGDLNGSATVNELQGADTRTGNEDLVIHIEDQQLKVGEEYTIDFTAKDFTDMKGYQFSLKLDPNHVVFEDIEIGKLSGLNMENFGFTKINEGIVTTSWDNQQGAALADDAIIFSLIVKAKSNAKVSDAISLNKDAMNAEAYNSNLDLMNVQFDFDLINETPIEAVFNLYQNQPNPFKEETLIGFSLAENEKATLTIYDIAGRTLKVIQKDFTQGYNSVNINRSDLGTGGVLYYRLETNEVSKTMKMILLN